MRKLDANPLTPLASSLSYPDVNRFQVKEMGSELSTERYPVLKSVLDFDPFAWRDTVMVPPNGRARIWVQYKNYTGKTVFHCHFLAHEGEYQAGI